MDSFWEEYTAFQTIVNRRKLKELTLKEAEVRPERDVLKRECDMGTGYWSDFKIGEYPM
jgi:hypothetical protein